MESSNASCSLGGLGLRPAKEIALAGYLSSFEASLKFSQLLLPEGLRHNQNPYIESALTEWKACANMEDTPEVKLFQSEWDRCTNLGFHNCFNQAQR